MTNKAVSDYVTEMFHKSREDISGIKHRLFTDKPESEYTEVQPHYEIDAIHEDSQSHEKDDKTIRATLNLPPAIRVDAKTEERQKPWHQDRNLWLQIGTIAVGIVVAVIYGCQLNQMIQSNKLTRKVLQLQYSQSRSLVQVTTTTFYKSTIEDVKKAGQFSIELQNLGKATASKIHGVVMVQLPLAAQEPALQKVGYTSTFTNPPLFSGGQPSGVGLILIDEYGTLDRFQPTFGLTSNLEGVMWWYLGASSTPTLSAVGGRNSALGDHSTGPKTLPECSGFPPASAWTLTLRAELQQSSSPVTAIISIARICNVRQVYNCHAKSLIPIDQGGGGLGSTNW